MIKEFEFYHGAVFAKLVHGCDENISVKSFPTSSNASYVLNDTVGLYVKHSSKRLTPWRFSFQKIHQDEILEMKNLLSEVFLVLVCGEDGMVTLAFDELKVILNEAHGETEWISAARSPRKEYTIKGSDGALGKKVSQNNFPQRIIEACTKRDQTAQAKEEYSWED